MFDYLNENRDFSGIVGAIVRNADNEVIGMIKEIDQAHDDLGNRNAIAVVIKFSHYSDTGYFIAQRDENGKPYIFKINCRSFDGMIDKPDTSTVESRIVQPKTVKKYMAKSMVGKSKPTMTFKNPAAPSNSFAYKIEDKPKKKNKSSDFNEGIKNVIKFGA
jgi:hypothetical protein